MKKIIILFSLLFLISCGTNNSENTGENPIDTSPDVRSLFIQTCENKDSACKQLLCNKENSIFICSDNPLLDNKNCGEEKSYDKIMNKYKICSENKELLKYNVFNYSEKKNEFFEKMTPSELEKKINEELAKVEEGGKSEWLGTFLAAAGGALLGGVIANKLFGGASAQVPQRPNNIENSRTIDKKSLEETKKQSSSETQKRNIKRTEVKKKIANSKKQVKKSTPTKRKTTRKKRRR